jgi:Fe-S cluster assembly iron-binding protein IscA
MFAYTDTAATLIRSLISSTGGGAASGLRLSVDPSWGSLRMELASSPEVDDQVLNHHDANVFVAGSAAARLDRRVLDARIERQRTAFFLVDRDDRSRLQ